MAFAMEQYEMSERQACKLVDLDRSSYRYEPRPDHNAELRQELVQLGSAKTALRLPAFARGAEPARISSEPAARVSAV